MTRRLTRYALEFLVFFLLFFTAFVGYNLRSEPTRFIYYNF